MANARSIDAGQATDYLAQVRRLLRQREFRRAIETIDRRLLPAVANGEVTPPVPVEDVRTYAYERLVIHGPAPTWRVPVNLRRGNPLSLRRQVLVDLRRLSRPALERVLWWLLAGEVRAAEEALRAGDYPAVVTAAEHAARIDDRSTRIALMHARGLYELAKAELNRHAPDLDDVVGNLQRAARLATRASTGPAGRDPEGRMLAAINELAATIEQRRARAARVEAVNSVVRRFNRLVQHYNDGDQIVSHVQLGNARASLAQIRADVERLSREHPADSPAGRVLADLRGRCAKYKEHLERLGRSVRAD